MPVVAAPSSGADTRATQWSSPSPAHPRHLYRLCWQARACCGSPSLSKEKFTARCVARPSIRPAPARRLV